MMDADIAQRQARTPIFREMGIARDMDERLRHAVDEGLGADEAMIGQHVGAPRHMLAAAEADLEMERTVAAEKPCGGYLALGRNRALRQQDRKSTRTNSSH